MENTRIVIELIFSVFMLWIVVDSILQGRKYRKVMRECNDLKRELNHYKKHKDVQDRIIKENQARLRKYESKQKQLITQDKNPRTIKIKVVYLG